VIESKSGSPESTREEQLNLGAFPSENPYHRTRKRQTLSEGNRARRSGHRGSLAGSLGTHLGLSLSLTRHSFFIWNYQGRGGGTTEGDRQL